MKIATLTVQVHFEQDVVLTRQRARQIAALLGFDPPDQTRIATAVSEIARNAFQYARGGMAEFWVEDAVPPLFVIQIRDQGPGLGERVLAILDRGEPGDTDLGPGITGARRLMDQFHLISSPEAGTTVRLGKSFPRRRAAFSRAEIAPIVAQLSQQRPKNPVDEIQQQNQELLR